jgi:hypothetical protein
MNPAARFACIGECIIRCVVPVSLVFSHLLVKRRFRGISPLRHVTEQHYQSREVGASETPLCSEQDTLSRKLVLQS